METEANENTEKNTGKTARNLFLTGVATVGLYFASTYLVNTYYSFKHDGITKYPSASTIEKIAEDSGNALKKVGGVAAGVLEKGIENGEQVMKNVKPYLIPQKKENIE